jgi:DNA-binding transcriptional LysR family regulator
MIESDRSAATATTTHSIDATPQFERLLTDVSSRFIDWPIERIDDAINDGLRQIVEERFATLGIHYQPHAIETNSWEAILDAVATTDMYSLAPRHEALWHGWAPRLVTIDIPELGFGQRTGIVTRKDAYLSPLAARAIELIEQSLAMDGHEEPQQKARAKRARATTA